MARPKRTTTTTKVKNQAPQPEAVKPAAEKMEAVKPEPEKTVVVEFAGKQIKAKDVLAQVEAAFKAARGGEEIKTIELYISVEQNAAYYVVNGESSENFKIQL